MTYFAEMPSLFSDHDDVTKHLPLEKGKLPSYLRDHRKRLRERFLSGGPTRCRIMRCWSWCCSAQFRAKT